jgi:hypothetical protein
VLLSSGDVDGAGGILDEEPVTTDGEVEL